MVVGEGQGPGCARNVGAREARGRYVVFIDAHCYTPPGWLGGLIAPLSNPSVALVGCALADLSRPAEGWAWAVPGVRRRSTWCGCPALRHVYPVPLLPGGCQALRTEDFLDFAQYDPGIGTSEARAKNRACAAG